MLREGKAFYEQELILFSITYIITSVIKYFCKIIYMPELKP